MKNETEYNTELTKIRHTNYVRNSRAIVVLWAIFSCIFLILNIVVFAQPQWIGDTGDSAVPGFFGVWEYCSESSTENQFICSGDFLQWSSFPNNYFRATAIMVGVSCIMFMLVILSFILFCLLNTGTVLQICAWFQILSGLLMLVSCIIYPGGWDHSVVQTVCGLQSGHYNIGVCGMRWAYALAIVLVCDAFILAVLAFVLAAKQANLLPDAYKKKPEKVIEKEKVKLASSHKDGVTPSEMYGDYYNTVHSTSGYSTGRKYNHGYVED
ncbi:unnamed protein product [Candidula unifasciata]|uniref:Lipoma HMGIC fusion partner-like 3 protein n=1 Tax=Candidula unifasciata TaxID=100452 RepID=A0A8S3YDE1_9EUPU|nr:unnamed protein product [Candidula unifasciata]